MEIDQEKHIQKWREVEKTALDACPVKIKAFAIVAIGEDGQVYWGGKATATPAELQTAEDRLKTLAHDFAWSRKQKQAGR